MSTLPLITIGTASPDVLRLKSLLHAHGYHKDTDDATYYRETAQIVANYQATHLGPSGKFLLEEPGEFPGIPGPATWAALQGETGQRQHAAAPYPEHIPPATTSPRLLLLRKFSEWYHAGVAEKPKGSNSDQGGVIDAIQKFHGFYHPGATASNSLPPWCAQAINYAHHQTLGTLPPWGKNARVASLWNIAKAAGLTTTDITKAQPGDLGVYISAGIYNNGTARDSNGHIFLISGTPPARILGLEGNSGDRLRASDRSPSYLTGIIKLFPPENLTFTLTGYTTSPAFDR